MPIAWIPPECQSSNARSGRTVGLCDEYDVNCSVAGSSPGLPWNAGAFCSSLYSPTIEGAAGLRTSIRRIQPHGQPKLLTVNVPYNSSTESANGRPGIGTAEWLSEQPAAVWPSQCGPVPQVRNGTGVSRSSFRLSTVPGGIWFRAILLVSRIPKPPRRYARYVRNPFAVGVIECSERSKS